MITQYEISGMTCMGCVAGVEKKLAALEQVSGVLVSLEPGTASILSSHIISLEVLQQALGNKYVIRLAAASSQASKQDKQPPIASLGSQGAEQEQSPWKQLTPLYLIFAFISGGVLLSHLDGFQTQPLGLVFSEAMLDFMALFYLVFSFFKFLDLKGFPESFAMYDPLAKRWSFYAKIYPFIELSLGVLLLLRWYVPVVLVVTLIILGLTTIGVLQSLLGKRKIQCACLGTALKLPMTQATFIENAIMIAMAVYMLL
jgi:copper chaperone CopZ